MNQPSWLTIGKGACSRIIEVWFRHTDWTTGEWGVHRDSKQIFDEDWSVWTPTDRLAI